MRAQNQLSFSDWQNLILFTKNKIRQKNFQVAVSGGRWQFPASSGSSGERCSLRRATAVVVGGGGRRRSMAVAVTINGARWWQ